MIPHSTGASSAINKVLPELNGKVFGTSVRVPISDVSLLDLVLEFENDSPTVQNISDLFKESEYYGIIYDTTNKNRVSSDLITTDTPSILDEKASMDNVGKNKLKLMVWYDNEWSYSAQLVRLLKHIASYNKNIVETIKRKSHFIEEMNLSDRDVVVRFDYNVNADDKSKILNSIPTIKYILSHEPAKIVITTHYGRPNLTEDNYKSKYSVKFMVTILEKLLNEKVHWLEHPKDLKDFDCGIFLLENVRFNPDESKCDISSSYANDYFAMGNTFIVDAFGCLHRDHLTISGMHKRADFINGDKDFGYGLLVQSELYAIEKIINCDIDKNVLFIIGGAKLDKLEMIDSLSDSFGSTVFVSGFLASKCIDKEPNINLILQEDGKNEDGIVKLDDNKPMHDIGPNGIKTLMDEIDKADIILWNGPLGIIEDPEYKKGTYDIMAYLFSEVNKDKQIIIGGGETGVIAHDIIGTSVPNNIHISTGGGALLEFLWKGYALPGLQKLDI